MGQKFKIYYFVVLLLGYLLGQNAIAAQDMRTFLKTCAIGTGAGALIGTMSLVLTNKPSENLNNIAKGASLGLYGGIIYGFMDDGGVSTGVPNVSNPELREDAAKSFVILPHWDEQNNLGAQFQFMTSF